MFETTFQNTITTSLLPSISRSTVIQSLQSPTNLISNSPKITHHKLRGIDERDGLSTQLFDVWESIDLLPGWMVSQQWNLKYGIQIVMSFHCEEGVGCTSWTEAALGFRSKAVYRVIRQKDAGDDDFDADGEADRKMSGDGNSLMDDDGRQAGERWVLEERVETTVSAALRWFVEGQLLQTRKLIHLNLLEKLKRDKIEEGIARSGSVS